MGGGGVDMQQLFTEAELHHSGSHFIATVEPGIREHCCHGDFISTRTLPLLPLYKHTHTQNAGSCLFCDTVPSHALCYKNTNILSFLSPAHLTLC